MLILVVVLSVLLIGTSIAIFLLLRRLSDQQQLTNQLYDKNQELNSMVNSGELKALRYKLNPHLFKNALNSIQSHAYQTYYSMDKLSGVLDYVLYDSDQPMVQLSEEMEFAANFIEINRLKVSPLFDLRIRNTIPKDNPDIEALKILPLVTVDLIENAFKHTNFQKSESFISILISLEESLFTLEVSNHNNEKEGIKKKNSGLGLKNLEERLQLAYPERHTLSLRKEGNVFHAKLTLHLHA